MNGCMAFCCGRSGGGCYCKSDLQLTTHSLVPESQEQAACIADDNLLSSHAPVGDRIDGSTDVIYAPRGLRISFPQSTLYFQLHHMAPTSPSVRRTRTLDREAKRREHDTVKKSRFYQAWDER